MFMARNEHLVTTKYWSNSIIDNFNKLVSAGPTEPKHSKLVGKSRDLSSDVNYVLANELRLLARSSDKP